MPETKEEKSARVSKFWADKREAKLQKEKEKEKQKDEKKAPEESQDTEAMDILDNLTVSKEEDSWKEFKVEPYISMGKPIQFEKESTVVSEVRNDFNKAQVIKEPKNQYNMPEVLEVEQPVLKSIKGRVTIKPYLPPPEENNIDRMGLEKYNEAIMPGTYQIDRIGCVDTNGIKEYFTGLNENVPEIQLLPKDERIARVTEIRRTVAFLENTVANNFDVNQESCMDGYGTRDDNFWKKVEMFHSTGPDKYGPNKLGFNERIPTYWDGIELKLDNNDHELDTSKPVDLLIYYAIKARGLSMVAPSLQVAIEEPGYRFYLDSPYETAYIRTESKKLKGLAYGHLQTMYAGNPTKLFHMAKLVAVTNATLYKRGGTVATPPDQLYDDIFDYLEGKRGDTSKVAVDKFLVFYEMDPDRMKVRTVIKDAVELHHIDIKGDGYLYYIKLGLRLGKNIEEMVEYVMNPLNEDCRNDLLRVIENTWIK